ncbi:hypothetical protein PN419_00475 [Halorubrum ezzemoulense]|uniref:hypothetical protein n=1 Tax=Halorubrum ezzemoulense TaxID=337243 RepID=UPI00232FC5E0|nr:hypothetical protein [Halorubrum ezzemoulense]MDB9247482.1 hypothetical protein [Halorubrum ezzemoulense]MDB9258609.1 hypothetical protein [Halorubrum ezzemoulense]MDB9264532.1 hypothetical protein [Halorubrum ezzemoulense]MDB9268970.1 hypothetical protein [Halorubrum ezzemoulense]MDB9271500.1 hypothetical protein [Halorubrum ezzemoulense]
MSDDNDSDDIEWVANSPRAWGRGSTKLDALQRLCEHLRPNHLAEVNTFTVNFVKVRGFSHITGLAIHGDEILADEELDLDADDLRVVASHLRDAELRAGQTLVEAEDA